LRVIAATSLVPPYEGLILTTQLAADASLSIMLPQPAAQDRTVLVVAFRGWVFGLERATGQVRWETLLEDLSCEAETEIWIGDDVVIAASVNRLSFIAYATGQLYASVPLAGSYLGRPTMLVDEGHVYIGGSGQLACYTMGGQLAWLEPFKGKGGGSVALGLPGNTRQADDAGRQ
jgi:outer membrane protein assembly factor BamB